MKTIEFLQKCTLNEFEDWLKDVCIDNGFNNIEPYKSFKTIVINDLDYDNEKAYYIIQDRDNIKDLYETFKSYIKYFKQSEELFKESTRLFIYSYKHQFMNCNHVDLYEYKSLMKDILKD